MAPPSGTGPAEPLDMGGLVNNPEFKRLIPFFAQQATHDIKKHQQLLALLGAIATHRPESTTLAAATARGSLPKGEGRGMC